MNSKTETLYHIRRVNELLIKSAKELLNRAMKHDTTKLESPEVEYFDQYTEQLSSLTYDSPEYKENLAKLKPALDHHYAHNSHHPQHYARGINDMDIYDLIEMLNDWKASGERQLNGNILISLEKNKQRYGIDEQLYQILKNTVDRYLR